MPVGGSIPLTSFAPDLDPISPGVITDGNDMIPTLVGFRTLPDVLKVTQPLPARCRGAAALTFGDGVQWIVAGCCDDDGNNLSLNSVRADLLNAASPPPWQTEPLNLPLPVLPPGRWRFDVFQNPDVIPAGGGARVPSTGADQEIIAVDGVHTPFTATRARLEIDPTTAWKFLGGNPPIASHVAASDFFLFLVGELPADIPGGILPVVTNRWWASPRSDVWTLDVADESVSARLGQTPGPITGILAQRSNMIAYKANATYIGQLTIPPLIWAFNEASRQTGAQGQEGALAVRDTHNIVGPDDFFNFDGFSLNPIPNALRRWFTQRVTRVHRATTQARFDQTRSLAFVHYTTNDAPDPTLLNEWIALNFVTGQWATGQLTVQASIAQSIKYLTDTASGLILEDGCLYVYTATGDRTQPGAFLVTGDQGDRRFMYQTKPCRPAFTILNGNPTLTPLKTYVSGRPYTAGPPCIFQPDGWFNILSTGRLQRFRLDCDADCEIANLDLPMEQVGDA